MRVILKQDVKEIGKSGQVVEVSEGHARNLLFPRGLAVEATDANLRQVANEAEKSRKKAERLKAEAQDLAKRLADKVVTIGAKAGEGGRLYGAITAKEIALEAKRQIGFELDKRKLEMADGVRSLGFHDIPARIHPEVTASLRVHVVELKS
jgi:large subunit ribosomal protein L9